METAQRPVIEVLHVEGCPHYPTALALVERVKADLGVHAELRVTLIADQAAAEEHRFPGSPTIRVDGRDVEPGPEPSGPYTVACRLYRHEHGLAGQPQERWVRDALRRAAGGPERQDAALGRILWWSAAELRDRGLLGEELPLVQLGV